MGEASRRSKQASSGPSRLQRRAPASLKIGAAPTWNVAIPLLSPLASSPERKVEAMKQEQQQKQGAVAAAAPEKVVFKKWQHPAAPFYY